MLNIKQKKRERERKTVTDTSVSADMHPVLTMLCWSCIKCKIFLNHCGLEWGLLEY